MKNKKLSRRALIARINRKLPRPLKNGLWILGKDRSPLTDYDLMEVAQEWGLLAEGEFFPHDEALVQALEVQLAEAKDAVDDDMAVTPGKRRSKRLRSIDLLGRVQALEVQLAEAKAAVADE